MAWIGRLVRSGRVGSSCSRWWATAIARGVGTFVNNETTSKENRVSSSSRVWVEMNSANSYELQTLEDEFLTKGERMVARWHDS